MRIVVVAVLIATVVATAFLTIAHFTTGRPAAANQIAPAAAPEAIRFWPIDRAWSWEFATPPPAQEGDWISLWIREKSTPLAPGVAPPVGGPLSPLRPEEATREFGTGYTGRFAGEAALPPSGAAAVQLLDLSEVGAASGKLGQNLRVLAKLVIQGGETRLAGEDVYLPAGRFAGHSVRRDGLKWVNGELYLMTFYVRGDDRVFRYDVFVRRTANTPRQ